MMMQKEDTYDGWRDYYIDYGGIGFFANYDHMAISYLYCTIDDEYDPRIYWEEAEDNEEGAYFDYHKFTIRLR